MQLAEFSRGISTFGAIFKLVHSWNTGGEPELISVLHTTASTVWQVVCNINSSAQLSSMQSISNLEMYTQVKA